MLIFDQKQAIEYLLRDKFDSLAGSLQVPHEATFFDWLHSEGLIDTAERDRQNQDLGKEFDKIYQEHHRQMITEEGFPNQKEMLKAYHRGYYELKSRVSELEQLILECSTFFDARINEEDLPLTEWLVKLSNAIHTEAEKIQSRKNKEQL